MISPPRSSPESIFQREVEHECITAGFVPADALGALLSNETARMIADGADASQADEIARDALQDSQIRKATIARLRAENPEHFLRADQMRSNFTKTYKSILRQRANVVSGERAQTRVLSTLSTHKRG